MAKGRFDSTRLMPGRTGRNDKLYPGMRVIADVDAFHNVDVCTITAVGSQMTLNIRAIDSQGNLRILNIWNIRSTAPEDETPEAIDRWLNA